MRLSGFSRTPPRLTSPSKGRHEDDSKGIPMATAVRTLGDSGSRIAPAMGAMPYNLARAQTSREAAPRRIMVAFRAGVDDATLATFGHDRMSVDRAGRAGFPL